jgi:hypothetical protein
LLPHSASTTLRSLVTIRRLLSVPPPKQPTLCPHSARMTFEHIAIFFSYTTETQNKHRGRGKTHYSYYYYGGDVGQQIILLLRLAGSDTLSFC